MAGTTSPGLDMRVLSEGQQNYRGCALGEAELAKGYLSIKVETADFTKLRTRAIRNRKI